MYDQGTNAPSGDQGQGMPPTGPMAGSEQPQPQPQPQPQSQDIGQPQGFEQPYTPPRRSLRLGGRSLIILGLIIVVVVAGAVYVSLPKGVTKITGTTTSTIPLAANTLTACGKISSPGSYYLAGSIKTSLQSGACLNVTANNVYLSCGRNSLTGSGPYVGVPPFSYGIAVMGKSNVTITGCTIRNFSYGIYAQLSTSLNIASNNMSTNYMSNIYLSGAKGGIVQNNRLSGSASRQGSIYISNGSANNRFLNNTILRNQYFGIFVNSTGNTFLNNNVNTTPVSLYCGAGDGFKNSNIGSSNLCYNSTGCSFLACKGTNIPANFSQIPLSSPISGCGTISAPGSYYLSSGINMGALVNVSALLKYGQACITIRSNNVALNCRNLTIANASLGILATSASNVTINNCNVKSSGFGIKFNKVTGSIISNATLYNDTTGIALVNSSADLLSNTKAYSGGTGASLAGSASDTFQTFNYSLNGYGLYLNTSTGNIFNKGIALNNTKTDVYATLNSANSSYNIMQLTTCGLTNAQWATCRQHTTTNQAYTPISSCQVVSKSGNYSLTSNIVQAAPNCISIQANNVALSCASHSITAGQAVSSLGPAFSLNNRNNVSISNCRLFNFITAVNATNSVGINLFGISQNAGHYGFLLTNVTGGSVANTAVNGTFNVSIRLSNTKGVSLFNNNITQGISRNIGIAINNSINNRLFNNSVATNYIGIYIVGKSGNNTISNNTVQLSSLYDYYCGSGNSGINSENGNVNYGTTKLGCHWMALLVKGAAKATPCASETSADTIMLTSDGLYTYNATCFNVYLGATGTTINCNGHTLIATNGGTYASFVNAANAKVQNCFLKGFTSPIMLTNASSYVLNNTILMSGNPTSPAISVANSQSPHVQGNNVTTPSKGIVITGGGSGYLQNNQINGASQAYTMSGALSYIVRNNTANPTDNVGMLLTNSTLNILSLNNFTSSSYGLQCLYSSQFNNTDNGQNVCSINHGCSWIKSSAAICKSG